ncbi:MAG: ribosomal protein methylthiotransferase RimO [Bacteroidota bacterium]|jgi:ribosomal protein S12 methylthiotransferase
MKTKTLKKNKVNVVTLGCAKNIFDSEVMMAQLKANDYQVEHESEDQDASIVIINTCGFIDNAKEESINTILAWAKEKEKGNVDKVLVTGCLGERYRDVLEKDIPEVDGIFGTRELPRLLKTLKADYKHELVGERLLTTPSHYAYFKIAEGCDRPCSFCAIPLMRGKHTSTPMEDLVNQAKGLAKNGVKELILIAQDLTFYGLDLYKDRKLSDLLKHLSDVEGIDWIRLQYAYPSGFPLDVLDVMNERDNICKYLDMPLQHGTTKMLQAMRRGITREKTDDLIATIRDRVNNIALRTTLITGFPGETEDDFQELKDWVKKTEFDRLGVFTYSHEENTHAFSLKDDVPARVKKKRANEIMEIQSEISLKKNQAKVGQEVKVLIDRAEGEYFIGRTQYDSPEVDNEVIIHSPDNYLRIGDFVQAVVTDAEMYDLFAELKS